MLHGFDIKKHKKQSKIARLHAHYQAIIFKMAKELERANKGELPNESSESAEGSLLPDVFADVKDDSQPVEGACGSVPSEQDQRAAVGSEEKGVQVAGIKVTKEVPMTVETVEAIVNSPECEHDQ